MKGLFVAFEGVDRSGKTTQLQLLAQRLSEKHEVLLTREPGGTPVAEAIRVLLLADDVQMSARCEALLFAAARADHVERTIRPALERGAVVISDRFVDSSLAYQGVARGLGVDDVERINHWATDALEPDLTIMLDLPIGTSSQRDGEVDRMENEGELFQARVRRGLLDLAGRAAHRYAVIDASPSVDEVADLVWAAVPEPWR
ncbi:MAG TPA: dTMP kinase [Actinomycetota bacterium]|nr:dTMP kinase [Candidatus Nanopelagicales bacterium]HPJ17987.1 dTMP kinase [Actinomycetota bacterium]HPQ84204.1 dTMP kinase [Actinomycetota bacterium]HRV67330.1 dTMP kinase [Candidatus Nanopelagicales bacterium]